MARINRVFLRGAVLKPPQVAKSGDQFIYARVYVTVVRSGRGAADRDGLVCDVPLIMTRDTACIREIETWGVNDIVSIKGVFASRRIKKSSFCKSCGIKIQIPGVIMYINPIFCEKICHLESESECMQYLEDHRDVSNLMLTFGTLCREPSKHKDKTGSAYAQYQVALNRIFRIKSDPPELRTDYLWIKSYGKNAAMDLQNLHVGSEIFTDCFLQVRKIRRRALCGQEYEENGKPLFYPDGKPVMKSGGDGDPAGCGKMTEWNDHAIEMVPYGTEYISGYSGSSPDGTEGLPQMSFAYMLGAVIKPPQIVKNGCHYIYAMVYITVARGVREVGDRRRYMKCDDPVIITRDPELIREIETWEECDIVEVYGELRSRLIKKTTYCSYCNTRNQIPGALVYINPFSCEKRCHQDSVSDCIQYLAKHREVSNQLLTFGTLCRDPSKRRTLDGLVYTQYQAVLERKPAGSVPPEPRPEFPWVRSYGSNAADDLRRLHIGSDVFIDGFLQARSINRHAVCGQEFDEKGNPVFDGNGMPVMQIDEDGDFIGCGERYDWKDRMVEIVPYETEYIDNYFSDEILGEMEKKKLEVDESAGGDGTVPGSSAEEKALFDN